MSAANNFDTDLEALGDGEEEEEEEEQGNCLTSLLGQRGDEITELQRYRQYPEPKLTTNSLQWWKERKVSFPNLAYLARVLYFALLPPRLFRHLPCSLVSSFFFFFFFSLLLPCFSPLSLLLNHPDLPFLPCQFGSC